MGLRLHQFLLFILLFCCWNSPVEAKKKGVVIPKHNDAYSTYVKKLEAGQLKIDYKTFRESYIQSNQFSIASKKTEAFEKLKKDMYDQIAKSNYQNVIKITQAILSIDYTDMQAHKILKQSYAIIGDSVNALKYATIGEGLLNSILKHGDGKSCATAWRVIQLEEEKFILHYFGAKLLNQSSESNHGICDKMNVDVHGKKHVYFFEISSVFEGYKKLKDNQILNSK